MARHRKTPPPRLPKRDASGEPLARDKDEAPKPQVQTRPEGVFPGVPLS